MKKIIFTLGILAVTLTSCLKDKPNVDLTNLGVGVDLVESGLAYYSADAITDTGTITRTITVNLSSPNTLSTDMTAVVGVDSSVVTTYNAANPGITYIPVPMTAYTFPKQTVTIKAGSRLAYLTLTLNRNKLDPSKSYMLPIKLFSVSTGTVASNFNVHYYHIIGNDFAGTYNHTFVRVPAVSFTPSTSTFSPVSPTEFVVAGGYYTADIKYHVTFTRTVSGGVPMYSNFAVSLDATDVANRFTPNSINVTVAPSIVAAGYDATKSYTYAAALKLFSFQYQVLGPSGGRINTDTYTK